MCKVSFDYDDCLDKKEVYDYCKSLINKGVEVWVCTSRVKDNLHWNNDLYTITERLGIPKERIIFTDGGDKSYYLKDSGFLWHLDDMRGNCNDINLQTDVEGIIYAKWYDWKKSCDKILEENYC